MLSRYNPDPLCAACERAAGDVAGIVPTWLWDSAPMRAAWARLDPAAAVAILRATAGLTQDDLANLVEGWTQSMVSLIERGQRPLYDIRKLLAFVDAVDMPREALLPLIMGRPDATLDADSEADLWGDSEVDLNRRDFHGLAAGVLASAMLPPVRVPDQVDAAHIRYLKATVDRLCSRDQRLGGGAVLQQALRQFARARAMLDRSDFSDKIGRQLLAVTSDLGIVAGWLAFDHGDQRLSRTLYNEAQLLAQSSGDSMLLTHVFANMAMQALHVAHMHGRQGGGLARESLRLAELAGGAAEREASPRLHALIALRQAGAYALLGDEPAFRNAITQARRELDRGPHPADPAWTGFVIGAEVSGYEARGHVWLGNPARSISLYESVIGDATLTPRNKIVYQGSLAGALLASGERKEAIKQGLTVLPSLVDGQMTSARPLLRLQPVRAAADQAGDEEFCGRYDAAKRSLAG